ncbi:MAG: hypothetical protein ACI9TK_000743 [Flavobacteriaceae bacterium]|jgi:hypothetical protein|tara:strand:- start:3705 stop:4430 length:726 start_codon:yes stop_codon:yes gene_type:complete
MQHKFQQYHILLFFLTTIISAQEYEKINGAWNAVFFDYGLSDKLTIRSEFHVRTVSFLNVWNQQIFRPSITYSQSNNLKWSAGYSFIKNFNSEVTASPRVRLEHNIWEQLIYNTPLKKGIISSRLRLEHRFQEVLPLKENLSLRDFNFSSRIRYRFTCQRLLSPVDAKIPVSLVIFDEVFVFMNPKGIPFKFNQNWTFFGFKIQLNKKLMLSTGFQKITFKISENNYFKNRLWSNTLVYKL